MSETENPSTSEITAEEPPTELVMRVEELEDRLSDMEDRLETVERNGREAEMMDNFGY